MSHVSRQGGAVFKGYEFEIPVAKRQAPTDWKGRNAKISNSPLLSHSLALAMHFKQREN